MSVNQSDPYFPIYTLARLGLSGKRADVAQYLKKFIRGNHPPETTQELVNLLDSYETQSSSLREHAPRQMPIDKDSRLNLLREDPNPSLDEPPIFSPSTNGLISRFLAQRREADKLEQAGITPANTLLLWGPPGTGKTLTARHIASELKIPLLVLDLSSVMSSFLGRTGMNIKRVLDYAKGFDCVLLLDELDAIAKRRDDAHEIGELKRLVTVLLQEIDEWPVNRILIGATNHPELLDPAVWRRFDTEVKFSSPTKEERLQFIKKKISRELESESLVTIMAEITAGWSYASLDRMILNARRSAILENEELTASLHRELGDSIANREVGARIELAVELHKGGISKIEACRIAGISRPTLDKHLK